MPLIKFSLVDRMFDECGAENGGGREVGAKFRYVLTTAVHKYRAESAV